LSLKLFRLLPAIGRVKFRRNGKLSAFWEVLFFPNFSSGSNDWLQDQQISIPIYPNIPATIQHPPIILNISETLPPGFKKKKW
jgi:hypothetical protein